MDNIPIEYNLPHETEQILKQFNPARKCTNLGLLLDKYIPKRVFEKSSRENPQAGKAPWLLDIFKQGDNNSTQNNHIDSDFASNAYSRWRAMLRALGVEPFNLTIDWRMIVGLGGETVLETDLTLHHLYGIPIIPGSALKGLTRAYVAAEYKDFYVPEDEPDEEKRHASKNVDEDHSFIKRIFGKQEEAGTVIFFDAMPLHGEAQFVVDIMNPHYPDYYKTLQSNNINAPTNDQKPNLVTFLTVTNTTFSFALSPRDPDKDQHKADVVSVKNWLSEALQKYGVGGKTSAGYGYFQEPGLLKTTSAPTSESAQIASPVASQTGRNPKSADRIRARIPQFRVGQDIVGSVLAPADALRQRVPAETRAFLRYQSFDTQDVLIVVAAEEAANWKTGETRNCQLMWQEERDGCLILLCQPRSGKKKKD